MKGCIYLNGVERQSNGRDFKKDICYIMQDDQLLPIFTVMETMMMAADLKLGRSISEKAKLILVGVQMINITRTIKKLFLIYNIKKIEINFCIY